MAVVAPAAAYGNAGILRRLVSHDDMRKEGSKQGPQEASPSPVNFVPSSPPRPAAIKRGTIPSLKQLCISGIIRGILSNHYKRLNIAEEMLAAVASKMLSKQLITDDNVFLFAPLPEVVLSSCPITDKGIHLLMNASEENSMLGLQLENTCITDEALRIIHSRQPRLQILDLSHCEYITERGISYICESFLELRYLGLRDAKMCTDSVVAALLRMPHLVRLDLTGNVRITDSIARKITSTSLFSLAFSSRSDQQRIRLNIEELQLSCWHIQSGTLTNLASWCPNLTSLTLTQCPFLLNDCLSKIISFTPHLNHLTLQGASSLTDDALNHLKSLETLTLLDNPQLSLQSIRKLVNSTNKKVRVFGQDIGLCVLRNAMSKSPFSVSINEYDRVQDLVDKIQCVVQSQRSEQFPTEQLMEEDEYRLRRVTYRKNGTKRPGTVHSPNEYTNLVRELIDKKHHIYLDESPFYTVRRPAALGNGDIFLSLRLWDDEFRRPRDLIDVVVSSGITLEELKGCLHRDGFLPKNPDDYLVVEEETDWRVNILGSDTLTLAMYGIIPGDILHFEEKTPDKVDVTGHIRRTHTGDFLTNRPTKVTIQETEESVTRRKQLHIFKDLVFKFDVIVKPDWTFEKLKFKIASKTGVNSEFIRLSTRVEPAMPLIGKNQNVVDVLGGNLWLLMDLDSAEMIAEKVPIIIHHFARNGLPAKDIPDSLLIRKTLTLAGLKERIHALTGIPEDLQLVSKYVEADEARAREGKSCFLKQVYMNSDSTIEQLGLHHIRVDECESPYSEDDFIFQAVQFAGWKSTTFHTVAAIQAAPQFVVVPRNAKFNEVKAAIALACCPEMDVDDLCIKFTGSLRRELMFEITPRYFEEQSSVTVSSVLRHLDILCWSETPY